MSRDYPGDVIGGMFPTDSPEPSAPVADKRAVIIGLSLALLSDVIGHIGLDLRRVFPAGVLAAH